MSLSTETRLEGEALDEFIARHETGVLSLSRSDVPYAIPISYGYNVPDRRFYLRLVSTPESEKRRFLASNPQSRLVIYEGDQDVYRSVVATGPLEEIARDELSVEHIEQYGEAKRPLFEIWGRDKEDLNVRLYKLEPEQLSGRLIEVDRD